MIKKLIKHGDSYALIIDKPTLELLHATPETSFEILTDENMLTLFPVREKEADQKFEDALSMVHKRFGNAMKKLAEN